MIDVIVDGSVIGQKIEFEGGFVFFGNANGTRDIIESHFSDLKFSYLKQVHGDNLVEGGAETPEADGQYTGEKNLALCIQTADCLPVFVKTDQKIFALHCGWRGVACKLATKVKGDVQSAWIGPHIPYTHFEVGKNVANEIVSTYDGMSEVEYQHPDPEKSFVDLATITYFQMGIEDEDFFVHPGNTLLDENWNSHRRDQTKNRNISFVVLVPS